MNIRFQGTFEFKSNTLKKHADWADIQTLGTLREFPPPPSSAGPKLSAEALVECKPDKDVEVGSFLLQRAVAFKYTPTLQIKKQMHTTG